MTNSKRSSRRIVRLAAQLGCLAALGICPKPAAANDEMYPPLPQATSAIDFDAKGFLIHGRRTFITSGSIHYARVPHELWRDRLLRLKRGGFNTVQTYLFWNFHERQEGKFDFTGDGDIDAFLKTANELGLYATVRPGPYVCAEWDNGGYPNWLRFKPDVQVRTNNPNFLKYADRWYERALPIIARQQISKGGPVILVQVENEHPNGWGTDDADPYLRHLHEKAVALGIEVPTFLSGLHHGPDPAGSRGPFDAGKQRNPWYTTEFWPGWFTMYGPLPDRGNRSLLQFDRGTWKIIAFGGNGYNFYMLHGGSNFATWNDNEDAASYDYGGAIGQAGDLRPIYYRFKRANWFARSFQEIPEDSRNSTSDYADAATGVKVYARTADAGTIVFLDNPGTAPAVATLKDGAQIKLDPGEITGVVRDFQLAPGVKIDEAATRLLGFVRQGKMTTLVAYGSPGESAQVRFGTANGAARVWKATIPESGVPVEARLAVGDQTVRVLAMSKEMADRTWFVDVGGKSYVIAGPHYVGDVTESGGKLRVVTEEPAGAPAAPDVLVYGEQPEPRKVAAAAPQPDVEAPALGAWQMRPADGPAAPAFDDAGWTSSPDPQPMGADGDSGAACWYRTTIDAPETRHYVLYLGSLADVGTFYVNGARVLEQEGRSGEPAIIPLDLRKGPNPLAVFCTHRGRGKFFPYIGSIEHMDVKGIAGPAILATKFERGTEVRRWSYKLMGDKPGSADEMAAVDLNAAAPDWKDARPNRDVFRGAPGYAWFRTTVPAVKNRDLRLKFDCVDDNAVVYVNGRKVGEHQGWENAFEVAPGDAWRADGNNVIAVLVQNLDGAGGITGGVHIAPVITGAPVKGWKLHGDVGGPADASPAWQPVSPIAGSPAFYRTTFQCTPPADTGPHPILRASMRGMSRGFVWLNGHNLGLYPERIPVDGLYLPECWLRPGENELVVLDEDGHNPSDVKLIVEKAASRNVTAVSPE